MTIQKQVDNLIDWYKFHGVKVDQIVLNCSRTTIRKFCEQTIMSGEPYTRGGVTKNRIIRGPWMYRDYKIIRAEKTDPRYKAQVDAFRSAVA